MAYYTFQERFIISKDMMDNGLKKRRRRRRRRRKEEEEIKNEDEK